MKKFIFISLVLLGFALLGNISNNTATKLEKLNIEILKAEAIKPIGSICYGGCQYVTPSDLCVLCTLTNCPRLVFGSESIGYSDNCPS